MNYKYFSFTFSDYVFTAAWLIVCIIIALAIYLRNAKNPDYRYFIPHFCWKIFLGIAFATFYVYTYGSGDTTAYYQGAECLKNLAYEDFGDYLHELISGPSRDYLPSYYNSHTGIPPIWVYKEPNSWFICKLASFFSFFTFNSYLALNLIFSFISTLITWRFFLFARSFLQVKVRYVAISILFIPTVGFWCTGLLKDTVVYCASLVLFMNLIKLLNGISLKNILFILLASYIIGSTRSFVLISILIPFFITVFFQYSRRAPFTIRLATRMIGIGMSVLLVFVYFRFSSSFEELSSQNLISTAETIYNDFQQNQGYTGKRYDLGITEFTAVNMLRATPTAIFTAIYRPFIWESNSFFMLLNGLESLVLLYFTLKLFRKRDKTLPPMSEKARIFFTICLFSCLIMAFFVGLTSGLFGVLVRLKAPLLPFFLLFVFHRITDSNTPVTNEKNALH
ncbi:hypothetical protein [Fluviicola sp.]|uniref:hypothetical protein n=1 Tax=Fluviicola sp. TaxID=1917219 RepID=UPI0031DEEDB0